MGFKELAWEIVDWIYVAQNWNRWRVLVNMATNFRIP
jgi:hypothetical protein